MLESSSIEGENVMKRTVTSGLILVLLLIAGCSHTESVYQPPTKGEAIIVLQTVQAEGKLYQGGTLEEIKTVENTSDSVSEEQKTVAEEIVAYNDTPYLEAISLIESGKYIEAKAVLAGYEKSEPEAYNHYKADVQAEKCNAELYDQGLDEYISGNYEEAIKLFEYCDKGYKDSSSMIQKSQKAVNATQFEKVESDGSVYWVTNGDLSGKCTIPPVVSRLKFKYSIKICGNEVFFDIQESDGDLPAEVNPNKWRTWFDIELYDKNGNEIGSASCEVESAFSKTIKSVIISDNVLDLFLSNDYFGIKISNDFVSFDLGYIDTYQLQQIIYNKEPYDHSVELIKSGEYLEALEILEQYKKQYPSSFDLYDAEYKVKAAKSGIYNIALEEKNKGNYEKAIEAFKQCGWDYYDAADLIAECRAELGLLSIGDFVRMGKDKDGAPIDWVVLKIYEDKALLASYFNLVRMDFNEEAFNGSYYISSWGGSKIQKWLNDSSSSGFYGGAFSDEERNKIVLTRNETIINGGKTSGLRNVTSDYVFILSSKEIEEYGATKLWGHIPVGEPGYSIKSWTRDPDASQRYVCGGSSYWVRPAMWIMLDD